METVNKTLLSQYKGIKCYYSELIHGKPITFCLENENIKIYPEEIDNTLIKKYKIKEALLKRKNLILEGIIFENEIKFFNIIDINKNIDYNYWELCDFLIRNDFSIVPILNDNFILIDNIDELIKIAKGKSFFNNSPRKGIVIRPLKFNNSNENFIFKVKNSEWKGY